MQKDTILKNISENPWMFKHLAYEERADADITLAAVTQDGMQIEYAINPTADAIKTAIMQNQSAFLVLPLQVQTKELAVRVLQLDKADKQIDSPFLPRAILAMFPNDTNVALAAIQNNPASYRSASQSIKENPIVALTAISLEGILLKEVPAILKNNHPEFAYAAVKQDPFAIAHVPKSQLSDDLILLAVKQNGMALRCVKSYKISQEIAEAATANNPNAKKYVPISLRIKMGAKAFINTDRNKEKQHFQAIDAADISGKIKVRDIPENILEIMKEQLSISKTTVETFRKMEEKYSLRDELVKPAEVFEDICREIAREYAKSGVTYAELSYSAFFKPERNLLRIMESCLPEIEKETGVRLRFLSGISRHADKNLIEDNTDKTIQLAKSKYIVGVDFMAHETNSTKQFEESLIRLANYAMENDPEFVIRIHAGESSAFPDNVKDALKIIYDAYLNKREEHPDVRIPQVRIGHGLHGIDDETFALLKKMNTIVEINPSSNFSLNNIDSLSEIPLRRFTEEQIRFVIGTDSPGMYSTSPENEGTIMQAAGLRRKGVEIIQETEAQVIRNSILRDSKHRSPVYDRPFTPLTENREWRFSPKKSIERIEKMLSTLRKRIIPFEEPNQGKKIFIIGAHNSFSQYTQKEQRKLEILAGVFASSLDKNIKIVTTGSKGGIEELFFNAAKRTRHKSYIITVLEAANEYEHFDRLKGRILEKENLETGQTEYAKRWEELTDILPNITSGNTVIVIGGQDITKDVIQALYNKNIDLILYDGKGASKQMAKGKLDGKVYTFSTIESLMKTLYERNLLKPGWNLDKLDRYISIAAKKTDPRKRLSRAEKIQKYINKTVKKDIAKRYEVTENRDGVKISYRDGPREFRCFINADQTEERPIRFTVRYRGIRSERETKVIEKRNPLFIVTCAKIQKEFFRSAQKKEKNKKHLPGEDDTQKR